MHGTILASPPLPLPLLSKPRLLEAPAAASLILEGNVGCRISLPTHSVTSNTTVKTAPDADPQPIRSRAIYSREL